MRIVSISDTHGSHRKVNVPYGDVLIHAGDFMSSGREAYEIIDFNLWLYALPHRHKIVIAGNHDTLFESNPGLARSFLDAAIYLENSGVTLDGVHFWGSPVTPEFMNWAFNVERGAPLRRYWNQIPEDTDVLITHGPPIGILDTVRHGGPGLGCDDLLMAVSRLRIKLHLFGHIHGGYGEAVSPWIQGTQFANCSQMNEAYRVVNAPIVKVLDIPEVGDASA